MWQTSQRNRAALLVGAGLVLIAAAQATGPAALAQADSPAVAGDTPGDADQPLQGGAAPPVVQLNFLELILKGGWFMAPIALLSLLVVAFAFERTLGLRRSRVLPAGLVAELGRLAGPKGGFDPRKAYRLCQQYPSAAATVIRAMLLKIGRPHSEVEHAVAEASEREAARMYANVRWLNLAVAVAPLLGLLGTVWGMIRAFHDTTQLAPGQNKADYLAEGIYVALVTTLAGLSVAIPAAIFAHYFEGRIQTLFHHIDELLFSLLPQIERYEGRVRFSGPLGESEAGMRAAETAAPQTPPRESPAAAPP